MAWRKLSLEAGVRTVFDSSTLYDEDSALSLVAEGLPLEAPQVLPCSERIMEGRGIFTKRRD